MSRDKTLKECGKFKQNVHKALYKSSDIVELLLGDTTGVPKQEVLAQFKEYVKSHLFVEDTITKADTFIYYDVTLPHIATQVKSCRMIMYIISERTVIDNYSKEGYVGNKVDILSEMVMDALVNDEDVANSFGIGKLRLDNVGIYNASRFYGRVLEFEIPSFA